MKHTMKLYKEPFEKIAAGKKPLKCGLMTKSGKSSLWATK